MPASPQSPYQSNTRAPRQIAVLIGADDGAAPTSETDIVEWLKPLRITRPAGGQATHEIELQTLLEHRGHIEDTQTPTGYDRTIEVREVSDTGDLDRLLGWGKVAAESLSINRSSEQATVSARIDWSMIGPKRLDHVDFWDGYQQLVQQSEQTAVFNPLYDGVVRENRSSHIDDTYSLFADPSAYETASAAALQVDTVGVWTIAEAVHTICGLLNPDETYVTNPTLADLKANLDDPKRDELLINHVVELGTSLPDALDGLLRPYGYWWSLEFTGDVGSVETTFVFGLLGDGVVRDLKAQRIGGTFDAGKTQFADDGISIEYDIVSNPNEIRGYTGLVQREITIKLYPAWDEADDTTTLTQINSKAYRNGPNRNIGRKWVANEAGDYDDARAEFSGALALPVGWNHVVRRRVLLPALTLDNDGDQIGSNGYRLRYFDSSNNVAEYTWSFSVMAQELGVFLEGNVPDEVWNGFVSSNNTKKYLEITASIELDYRKKSTAARRSESPNGRVIRHDLDLSDKFVHRLYETATGFKSIYADDRSRELVGVTEEFLEPNTSTLLIAGDQTAHIAAGQTISVADAIAATERVYEGRYIAESVVYLAADDQTRLRVREKLTVTQTVGGHGTVYLNTNAEDCTRRLTEYCERVRDEQDQALVAVEPVLHGIDHPQYELGDLISGIQPRNISLDAHAGDSNRYPQIVGLTYTLNPTQKTRLHLEEYLQDADVEPLPEVEN